jgi:ketosteroid isomerase-like protein
VGVFHDLTVLQPMMQQALSSQSIGKHYAAGKIKSLEDACSILGLTYDMDKHLWQRNDIDETPAALSEDFDTVIRRLRTPSYHSIESSEASARVAIELVLLDRLHHLADAGAMERLRLYPEADMDFVCGNTHVTGRADWLLCHEDPRYAIESTLIAIEAKRSYDFNSGGPQMAVYLAAVQASRANIPKFNSIAFGITTDCTNFKFWFLDSERRLYSSTTFDWRIDQAKIIAWIDKMLVDAIEASFLTTPTLQRNVSLRNWERNFRRRLLASSDSDSSPVTAGLPFDIFAPESAQFVGTAVYRGQKVMIVEYDAEDSLSEAEDQDNEDPAVGG